MSNLRLTALMLAAAGFVLTQNPAGAEPRCAKDMFFDQLEAPGEAINTGLKYWIQLRRNGKTSIVDNRCTFQTGDQIRFLIVPNITGFAYAALTRGSTGAQKVLFPNTYEPNGKVVAGKQYFLPAKGYLQFDKNAGTENVRLVVSRKAVAAASLLQPDSNNWVTVETTSPVNVPTQSQNCVLTFGVAENKGIEFNLPASEKETEKPEEESTFAKDINYVPALRKVSRIRRPKHRISHHAPGKKTKTAVQPAYRPGAVTLINIEPAESLGADIQLAHK